MQVIELKSLSAKLRQRLYPAGNDGVSYTNVPNKNLPSSTQELIKQFVSYVGLPYNAEDHTVTVRAKNTSFDTLLIPSVLKQKRSEAYESLKLSESLDNTQGDEYIMVIKWGLQSIPVEMYKKGGADVTIGEGALAVYIETAESPDGILFEFPLRLGEEAWENKPPISALNQALKKGTLVNMLSEVKKYTPAKKMSELPEDSTHIIVGYESREGQFGLQYTLTTETGERILANRACEEVLSSKPVITKDCIAQLKVFDITTMKSNGRLKVNCALIPSPEAYVNETEAFDLDF